MKTRSIFAAVLLLGFAFGLAQAEPWAVRGNITVPFTAGGKVLPAGEYTLIPDAETMTIRVEPAAGQPVLLTAITRLAMTDRSRDSEARIVFDKVGDVYTLSELWLPGEEGYLIHATKGSHGHHTIHLPPHLHR